MARRETICRKKEKPPAPSRQRAAHVAETGFYVVSTPAPSLYPSRIRFIVGGVDRQLRRYCVGRFLLLIMIIRPGLVTASLLAGAERYADRPALSLLFPAAVITAEPAPSRLRYPDPDDHAGRLIGCHARATEQLLGVPGGS
ncbi:MAG: hypothetical protein M3Y77_10900 [Actinomycetota bacterium]|nr:hypothetical protein [Actinomycetota bacterium]MDQ2956438.1 hypothetical protein [Actinomycetota bacterium]